MLFSKPRKAIGLDVGSHSVKAVLIGRSSGRLCIEQGGYAVVDRAEVNQDPVMAHANAIREALRQMPVAQCLVVGAMAGQTAVVRYNRINEVPRDQLEAAVEKEAGLPYDLSEVFLDWTLLDEVDEGGQRQLKVLVVAAKHEVIESRIQLFDAAQVDCGVLGVDSLALADAAEGGDFLRVGETVAIVDIGMGSASIHFVRDGISNFIREVNWGAREMVQAIAKDRRCDLAEAERLLQEAARQEPEAPAEPESAFEEPALAEPEPAPSDFGDDPFGESGGGSLLDPLDDEMDSPMGGAASGPAGGGGGMQGETPIREILSQPLARMVSEIRRSFDFYEHQLYEKPVDRIILSGGVAHLPLVGATFIEELGVDSVEVADPTNSAFFLGDEYALGPLLEQPAQFMVAIGLAARGMADL